MSTGQTRNGPNAASDASSPRPAVPAVPADVPAVEQVQNVDDIKAAKAAGKPVTEFERCLQEATIGMQKYEAYMTDCQNKILSAQGFTDGIDCIPNFEQAPCRDGTRYNAQVDASKECMANRPADIKNRITILDCQALAGK